MKSRLARFLYNLLSDLRERVWYWGNPFPAEPLQCRYLSAEDEEEYAEYPER